MSDDPVLTEMLAALGRSPEVVALRVRVIELLAERGRYADALSHCGAVLTQDPGNPRAVELLQECTAALAAAPTNRVARSDSSSGDGGAPLPASGTNVSDDSVRRDAPQSRPIEPVRQPDSSDVPKSTAPEYDWAAAEDQVGDIIAPAFVDDRAPADFVAEDDVDVVSRPDIALAQVGGMVEVKRQLALTLLGPMRNPELAKAFGTSARGGLLLYGPPGCGKTFVARAVAGEIGANFYPIEISDVLDVYHGASERNVHQIFELARRNAPCVLFLDEVDALGFKRSQMAGNSLMRTVVNQLLHEMDSATRSNDGVYILGATNHPWDLDVALRRPGRFDRMILVGLPDPEARAAILRHHLRERPIAGIDLSVIVARTDGFSGADLAHVCTTATQLAMADALRTGAVRPITMADIGSALSEIRPTAGAWFESARNVVEFANGDGAYDELAKYLRTRKSR
ncbi:ATP-binding protein [Nocardia panacis]|uniref:ATP-binding protein n=1 Tax=Nocardia panacis TaxID=2340916 RepID=A0A3A4K945_9NOCA|nr:ATP-binding protein [Nocardia panacis]RJO77957.1 ATP-binding protein [Nocardia panacis]